MKKILPVLPVISLLMSCGNNDGPIVDASFVDSLITNYSSSQRSLTIDSNVAFWEKRMSKQPDDFVNGPEYASALSSHFQLYGDIHDLVKADSLVKRSNEANGEKEPGILRTLVSYAMLRHRFTEADSLLKKALQIEGMSFPNAFTNFDVAFERGEYHTAKKLLGSLQKGNSYGYLFRRSKYEHYDGSLDSAISCMKQAAEKAGTNNYLKQVALSNAADLYIHKGELSKAYDTCLESIKIDASDFHSFMCLGWIALVHDKNDSLAEKIFLFVKNHTRSPDALLKLAQLAEAKNDSVAQKRFAVEFATVASDSIYGKMYSKYLVDLYTGILNDPAKATKLAEQEINNRPTPQVYAWYAWSLYCHNEKDKAYKVFKNAIAGKPLEGPELYYMGKMMEGLNKKYNAQQFFKAAWKNRYDLSPSKQKYLEKNSE